jgi:hypothetical protein
MAEKWSSVTVECWNYRYHSVGRTRTVEIGQNRYCTSDCDATTCPLNKPKKVKQTNDNNKKVEP